MTESARSATYELEVISSKPALRAWSGAGNTPIAFVPTMGFLHEGHLALMQRARQLVGKQGRVVVSIFVNPTQFDRSLDLSEYPRDIQRDLAACREQGVNAVFVPEADDFYAADRSINVIEGHLSSHLCGATRPGHFSGVCLVLTKLFSLIRPDFAVFGQKDYQQLAIVRRLVRDLELGLEVIGVPTFREPDGLAMSSRNAKLSDEMRQLAPSIRRGMLAAQAKQASGVASVAALKDALTEQLADHSEVRIDYLEVVDGDSLQPVEMAGKGDVMAIAVFFGEVRLIDNLVFGSEERS